MARITVPPSAAAGENILVTGDSFDPKLKFALETVDSVGKAVGRTSNTNRPAPDGSWHCGIQVPPKMPCVIRAYSGAALVAAAPIALKSPAPPPPPPPAAGVKLEYLPTPSVAAPAMGSFITDQFGNKVWTACTTQRHRYPLNQSWNADGSRILLDYTSGSAHIHLGVAPYSHLSQIQVPDDAIWSNLYPNIIYGRSGTKLVKVDISVSGQPPFQTVHDFGSTVSIGNYEGGISDTDRFIALSAGNRLIVWDLIANAEHSSIPLPSGIDGFQISRTGQYVVIRGGNTRVASIDSLGTWRTIDPYANHGGVCLISNEDWYVGNNAVIGTTAMGTVAYRLSDGFAKVLIPRRNAFEDGHTSGHGPLPMVSNYDAVTNQAGQPGRDQLVAVNFDGTVIPFGFAHHLTPDSTANYRNQPHATLDRTGTRALFMGWDSVACVSELP